MKIVIYQDRNLKEKRIQKSLMTIYKSLKENFKDHHIIYIEYSNFKLVKCDYAIMWNVYCKFKNDTFYRKNKRFSKENNNKTLIVELGFINRDIYYSFGFDNISNFGYYPEFPNNDNRLKLNLDIKELNYDVNPTKHILFCSQVPWDTQVQNLDYTKWVINTLKELKKYTNRKIILRKHPKHKVRPGYDYFDKNFLLKNELHAEISFNNLKDDLKNCYCVIAFNSTVLVDSILEGIPILSGDKSSIIYDLSTKKVSNIENLDRFKKEDIFKVISKLCYKQWTIEEFKTGEPFKYFFNIKLMV